MNTMDLKSFCKRLPKLELHAHLNGSLSDKTLEILQKMKMDKNPEHVDNTAAFKINEGHSRTLAECFAIFKIAHDLTETPEAIKIAMSRTLQEFNDDGVIYLELRSTPRTNENMTKKQYIQAMVDSILEAAVQMETRLLISIDRRNTLLQAEETINVAIEMAQKYPNIIVGIDLSGDPNFGIFKEIAEIINKARDNGLKITIHAAEIPAEDETLEILAWKPDRLGHMTCNSATTNGSLKLWNAIIDSKIPIELCLTSNVKSGSVKTFDDHHFQALFAAGHPISINTDDKGVFGTSLSEEFFICASTFNLTREELWKLSYDAIKQIFASDETKATLTKQLNDFNTEFLHTV